MVTRTLEMLKSEDSNVGSKRIGNTNYAKYVAERLEAEILENDFGFIVYQIKNEECFIVEAFIDEDFRQKGHVSFLFVELCNIASHQGCKAITANIFLSDKNSHTTLIASLKNGLKLGLANNGCITVFKKLGR